MSSRAESIQSIDKCMFTFLKKVHAVAINTSPAPRLHAYWWGVSHFLWSLFRTATLCGRVHICRSIWNSWSEQFVRPCNAWCNNYGALFQQQKLVPDLVEHLEPFSKATKEHCTQNNATPFSVVLFLTISAIHVSSWQSGTVWEWGVHFIQAVSSSSSWCQLWQLKWWCHKC